MYEYIAGIPLIDTHVHRVHPAREPEFGQIAGGYIPGPNQAYHARQTLLYGMIMQRLRRYYGLPEDATDEAVEQERNRRYRADPQRYMTSLMDEGNVETFCFEIGSPLRGKAFTPEEVAYCNATVPAKKRRTILRIERSVDELLPEKRSFRDFISALSDDLNRRIVEEDVVGLKSAVAYYGGLNLILRSEAEAAAAYDAICMGKGTPEDERCLYTFTLLEGIEVAVAHAIPVQIHTGAGGGGYLDFQSFNPVGLTSLLRDPRVLNRAKIVLLHGGHPHEEDTSFLTAQYSNVYTDCSGTFFLCSAHAVDRLRALLERAPLDKIMYGSDGVMFPETAWFAADYFRRLLSKLLEQLISEGFLRASRAEEVARWMMHDNAKECYSKLKECEH